jgi:hypothetical protein
VHPALCKSVHRCTWGVMINDRLPLYLQNVGAPQSTVTQVACDGLSAFTLDSGTCVATECREGFSLTSGECVSGNWKNLCPDGRHAQNGNCVCPEGSTEENGACVYAKSECTSDTGFCQD